MKKLIVLAAIFPFGCADTETASGPVYESSRAITALATVKSVDVDQRRVALEGPAGNVIVCDLDERVEKFPAPGDRVRVTYLESAAVEVVKKTGDDIEDLVIEKNPEAAGKSGREATLTAQVVGIDRDRGTVTLKEEHGAIRSVAVRHPERLDLLKIGDILRVTYKANLALTVDPAPADVR